MASSLSFLGPVCSSSPLLTIGNSKPCSCHNLVTVSTPSITSTFSKLSHHNRNETLFSPLSLPRKRICNRSVKARVQLNFPLISPLDHWGIWSALVITAAFGIWSERTKIGSVLSGALTSILAGLAASNLGIIPSEAPAYSVVFEYLLPLTVPLLLFKADLRRIIKSTGKLLLAFLLGSVATMVGTIVAYLLVPMRSLGQDNWKIAAALMGSYIGGAVNYVAISEALSLSPSVLAAGLAADNVICAIYFTSLFALASKIPPEASTTNGAHLSALLSLPVNHHFSRLQTKCLSFGDITHLIIQDDWKNSRPYMDINPDEMILPYDVASDEKKLRMA